MHRGLSSISAAVLLLAPQVGHAEWTTEGTWSTKADEGTYEVFSEGIDDWDDTDNSNLVNCITAAEEFKDEMVSAGYGTYILGTDANAWSSGWEEARSDDSYADASDFGYICSHGASDYVAFNGSSGDDKLTSSETKWGDGDVEAIAIDACKVLDSTGRKNYASYDKNDGIHYVFGFSSNALDVWKTGYYYGYYLRKGYTLASAWKTATKNTHDSTYTGASVRFYSSTCDTSSDTAYAMSCDPKSSSSTSASTWTL